MKIPARFFICGKWWNIHIDKKISAAGITYDDQTIAINPDKCPSEADKADTLLHEILEALFYETGVAYDQSYGKEQLYSFTHDKFQNQLVPEILSIIKQINFGRFEYGKSKKKQKWKRKVSGVQGNRKERKTQTEFSDEAVEAFVRPFLTQD